MSILRIALLQMTAHGNDQQVNQSIGETFCRRARDMNADIALFPEMWNVGYTSFDSANPSARGLWQAQAISKHDLFVTYFRVLAQELEMAIALTYLERWNGAPRNSVSLIDRHGDIVMTYAKVHTCDFEEPEASCTSGNDFYVSTLDTAKGDVKIGAMIGYDREFPESAEILMLSGAELILTPNACELEGNRIGQFRVRAYENMVGVAMTNYASPQYNGHSVAFDPIAFDLKGKSRDTLVIEAGESAGVYIAPFDISEIRAYRERNKMKNAFRRPDLYGNLTSTEVKEPFIRRY